MMVRNNIFVRNHKLFSPGVFTPQMQAVIDRNLLFANAAPPHGTRALEGDPLFRDPEGFDFRLRSGSPAITPEGQLGPYGGAAIPAGTEWWLRKAGSRR